MRKYLSLLLCLCLLMSALPARAEEAGNYLMVEPVEDTIRPGRAVTLAFVTPEACTVSLRLVDESGETVSTVVEDYPAAAGRNLLMWNGTHESVFAPAGNWQLELYTATDTVGVPVQVGQPAPYLTNIMSAIEPAAQTMTVSFYASVDGLLSVATLLGDVRTVLEDVEIKAGENTYVWDMSAEDPNTSALTIMLTDAEGASSTEEHIAVYPEDFGVTETLPTLQPVVEATEEPTEEPVEESTETPTQEPFEPVMLPLENEDIVMEEMILDDVESPAPAVQTDIVYTPSHTSPYEGQDASLNYWTMPMDITDEEAVWEVLMQPMTILYSDRSKAERTQVILREEPNEDSRGVGVVTRINQGVHVLETLDNGWSLIECYSASFHDSAIQAWNMLVQGYVKSDQLRTVEPQKDYGIVIDKLTQRLYLFKEGHLYSTLLVSTGLTNAKQPWNETRSGEFFLTTAVGAFKDGNLTFEMAIRFNSGDLLHEIPHYTNADGTRRYGYGLNELGSKASHGCIRVQRYRTPEGINMSWLWSNRVKNTKLLIWEDWQGRQIPYPDNSLTLYYNPDRGTMYHSQETCYSAEGKTFTPFTYSELDQAPYVSLDRCPYCAPALRRAEIDAINANYLPGGDHDPILTEARQKYLDSLKD